MQHLSCHTIDQYVSGVLSREERASVEQHSCQCDECQREIAAAALSLRVKSRIWQLLMEPEDGDELLGGPVAGRVCCIR